MKIAVQLSIWVRQYKNVIVEVPDDFEGWDPRKKRDLMENVYDAEDGGGYIDDYEVSCEQGEAIYIGERPEDAVAEFKVEEDLKVVSIEEM